jgi:hypothetical protein
MSDASIVVSNLSFSWPDDTPVFQDLSFTVPAGRTGLVAPIGVDRWLRLSEGRLPEVGAPAGDLKDVGTAPGRRTISS